MTAMDPLAGLLDGPRARGAFVQRCVLDPPCSIHTPNEATLSIAVVVRGRICVSPAWRKPCRLRGGIVMASLGSNPTRVADDPATPVQIIIYPG